MVWLFSDFFTRTELPDIIIAIHQRFAKKCQKSFISEGHVKIQIVPLFLNFPNAPWAITCKFGACTCFTYLPLHLAKCDNNNSRMILKKILPQCVAWSNRIFFSCFDTFCDPGEPSKREGEERQRSWTVSGSEESEHMSRCMLRINLRVQLNFASLLLSFFSG